MKNLHWTERLGKGFLRLLVILLVLCIIGLLIFTAVVGAWYMPLIILSPLVIVFAGMAADGVFAPKDRHDN